MERQDVLPGFVGEPDVSPVFCTREFHAKGGRFLSHLHRLKVPIDVDLAAVCFVSCTLCRPGRPPQPSEEVNAKTLSHRINSL